jgi:DNA/RNA endonuclease YhcR with UshA esterase domain
MEGWIMRLAPDIKRTPYGSHAPRGSRLKGVVLAVAVTITAACATVPGRPDIRQVQQQSGRFVDHSVTITGEVTSSWGVPLVGFNVYRLDDGTGEITVVSTDRRVPNKGARVEVRGKVEDVAVLGGRPLGLHLREQRVRYR